MRKESRGNVPPIGSGVSCWSRAEAAVPWERRKNRAAAPPLELEEVAGGEWKLLCHGREGGCLQRGGSGGWWRSHSGRGDQRSHGAQQPTVATVKIGLLGEEKYT